MNGHHEACDCYGRCTEGGCVVLHIPAKNMIVLRMMMTMLTMMTMMTIMTMITRMTMKIMETVMTMTVIKGIF